MKVTPFGKRRVALPEPAMRGLQALALRYHVTPEQVLEQVVTRLLHGRYEELEDIAAQATAEDWTTERPRFAVPAKVIDLAKHRRRGADPARVPSILQRARDARSHAASAVTHATLAREHAQAAVAFARVMRAKLEARRAG
jgi:hypothetical protein